MIRLARPSIDQAELDAMTRVLKTGMLVQGKEVRRFEESIETLTSAKHAIAVSNGTAALHLALMALDIGPGDEVLCPGMSWPSPAHAIRLVGATPVLVDIDPSEWNSCGDQFKAALTSKTKAAIAIDQFGNPVRAEEIRNVLAGIPIIEDAACAIGSKFASGRHCGTFADIGCLSFHPRKILTTGEGGMCLTDNPKLADRLQTLRNHGRDSGGEFPEASTNYRLTEFGAAMGTEQVKKLDAILEFRTRVAKRYDAELADGVRPQAAPTGAFSNRQTYGLVLEGSRSRDECVEHLKSKGIEAGFLSYALNRLPSVNDPRPLPNCEHIVDQGFAIPLHHELSDEDISSVINTLNDWLRGAG